MKAKKLIKKLQKLVDEYGNLPVNMYSNETPETVSRVAVYDKNGLYPECEFAGEPVELFLWSKQINDQP